MINQLTFTRFIAAILIVFYHFGDYLLRYNIYFIDVLRPKLNLGVSYFYVLSGFVMMVAYGNRDKVNFKQYYINRFARIYPLHILGTLSFIAVALWLSLDGFKSFQFELSALISHLFLIQAWIPKLSLSLNIPAWSISVEAFFYLLFPLIYNRFIRKTNKKTIFSVIIIFWIICQFAFNWYFLSSHYGGYKSLDRYFLSYNPFFHLNSFLVGILFGYFYINNKEKYIGKFEKAHKAYSCLINDLHIKNYNKNHLILTKNAFLHNFMNEITEIHFNKYSGLKSFLKNRAVIYCYHDKHEAKLEEYIKILEQYQVSILRVNTNDGFWRNSKKINQFLNQLKLQK